MAGQTAIRRLVFLLILVPSALEAGRSQAGEPFSLTLSENAASQPITLAGDAVSYWVEQNQRAVLLRGNIAIEQGDVSLRAAQAVVWVDLEKYRQTRVNHVTVFASGSVKVRGVKAPGGNVLLAQMVSRGDLITRAHKGKPAAVDLSGDPFYQEARAQSAPPRPAPPPVQQTGFQATAPGSTPRPAPPPVQQTGLQATAPGSPPRPAPPPVQQAGFQATAPGSPPRPAPPPVQQAGFQATAPGSAPRPAPQPVQQAGFQATAQARPPQQPPAAPGKPAETQLVQNIVPAPGMLPPAGPPVEVAPPPRPDPDQPPLAPPLPLPPPPPAGPPRMLSIAPRYGQVYAVQGYPLATGEQAIVVTGGIILTIRNLDSIGLIDIEADKLVFWSKQGTQQMFGNMSGPGQPSKDLEFYLAGNVEIRQSGDKTGDRVLRADQVFYDAGRNIAVAVCADLEYKQPGLPNPVHLKADELLQLSLTQFKAIKCTTFSSRLPSDPGLRIEMTEAKLHIKDVPKRSIFGREVCDRKTGQPITERQLLFRGENAIVKVEDIPVFYLPYIQGDAADPLGPLQNIQVGGNRIFGAQLGVTLDNFDLLGIQPNPGTRWTTDLDYMSERGPGGGMDALWAGRDLFGIESQYAGKFKAWGLYDKGIDVLGGGRGPNDDHPLWRGRFMVRNNWFDMPHGFMIQTQLSLLSDKNFLEQYYKLEFDTALNQETFLYVKQQQDQWAWTLLVEPRVRNWVTEDQKYPVVGGHLIGQSLFGFLTYNTHAEAGYHMFRPTDIAPFPTPPIFLTDIRTDTARLDWWHELSMPFYLGPVRVVPYGIFDVTYYSRDLTGQDECRLYGAGGVRGSLPFTRLYPDAKSYYLNVNGINHKVVLSANYFYADTNRPFTNFPQLDRLDDDATDQARRDITPRQVMINPDNGFALANSLLFNPQTYAIRRLVDNRIDTLDDMQVLQMDIRQRWQTKRGYPGMQHIVDYMVLDTSASYFPNSDQDNFGSPFAFLEYDWSWFLGDRTSLVSTGWMDPMANGVRMFTIGGNLSRPDRTNFYLGYRHIYPLNSDLVILRMDYVFSPKYMGSASVSYDFGTREAVSNTLALTRMGSDLMMTLGFTYNSLQNNFGVIFMLMPNLGPNVMRRPGANMFGSNSMMGR